MKPTPRRPSRPTNPPSSTAKYSASPDTYAEALSAEDRRTAEAVEREVNAAAPRMVADGIRLVRAKVISRQEVTLTYSLVALRIAEIEAELWDRHVRPMIVSNVRRAETQEARNLFAADVTVNYRYVDSDGRLIVQVDVAPKALDCDSGIPENN